MRGVQVGSPPRTLALIGTTTPPPEAPSGQQRLCHLAQWSVCRGDFPVRLFQTFQNKMQQRFQMPPWRTQADWKFLPVLIVRITHLLGLWLGKTICSRSKQWSLLTTITLAL